MGRDATSNPAQVVYSYWNLLTPELGTLTMTSRIFAKPIIGALLLISIQTAFAGNLTAEAKTALEKEVTGRVTRMAFVPGVDFSKWPTILEKHRKQIDSATTEESFAAAINAALAEFKQSHLQLITPELNNARRSGSRQGIGIVGELNDKGILLRDVITGSPAERAGMRPGETIVAINGEKPKSMTALSGAVGTEFELTLQSKDGKTRRVKVKREVFSTKQPESLKWIRPNEVAVLRIPSFDTYSAKRVGELMADGIKAKVLIVDLRNNPGGYVFNMLHAAGHLMPEGQSLGTMAYRYGVEKFVKETGKQATDLKAYSEWTQDKLRPLKPSGESKPFAGKIIVLTNGGTGSAAEILGQGLLEGAGAMVLGSKSAGQVLAAMITPMSSDFAMIVPIQDYISNKGVRLEGSGVQPNMVVIDQDPSDEVDAVLEAAITQANLALAKRS